MKRQVTTLSPGLAKEYDSTKAYAVDDYVLYGNAYWRCKTVISSPGEEWNPDHWRKEDVLSSKADLVDGKVPAAQLPEDWNDVQEFANSEAFPPTGTTGVLYVALDTNDVYRWSHSQEKYVEVGGNAAQLQADWNEDNPDSKAFIKNKPTVVPQEQADWNEDDTDSKAFIKNKPDVATKDDATLAPIITAHGVDGYILGEQYDYQLATREQGQKADTALQGIEVNGSEVTPVDGVVSLTIPEVSDDTPAPAGTATAGSASTAARSDHVHQAETSVSGDSVYVRSVEVAKAADIPTEAADIDALPATKSGYGTSEAYTVTLGTSPNEVTITLANSVNGTYIEVTPSSGFGATRYKFGGKIQKLVGANTWVEVETPDESGTLALVSEIYAAVQQIAPEWVANTEYVANSCVSYDGVVYQNTSGDTIQDDVTPDTADSGWTAKPASEIFSGIFAPISSTVLTPVTSGTSTTGYTLGAQSDKKLATQEQGLDGVEALRQLQFAIWYPDGSVKSAADFTPGIKFDETNRDTVNRTIDVLQFCDTGTDGENDNSGLTGRVVVPPYWDDASGIRYTVTAVDNPATAPLSPQTNVTEVVLPTTVKTIKAHAFSGCRALASIGLDYVTTVNGNAFYGCESLTSVSLQSAEYVRANAFNYCTGLTCVNFGNKLTSVAALGNVNAFPETAPAGCKIVVPDMLYATWTATSPWNSLISRGYRFLRYSEWDYARRYELEVKAPLASPTFTGEPKAPTADPGTNTTQIATTAFVKAACDAIDVSSQIAGKADKVSGATEDNLAALDNNGNLKDSGYKPSDFAAAADVAEIQGMIPPGADSSNQLADKEFVNSSIEAMAAIFRGTFNLKSDLNVSVTYKDNYTIVGEAIKTYIESQSSSSSSDDIEAENNDYVFIQIPETDNPGAPIVRVDRYKCTVTGSAPSQTVAWKFEYSLNNSSFTSDQWDAINSGIERGDVTKLRALPDAVTLAGDLADKYEKPNDGIPDTDMTTDVRTALSKAGSAIQGVQVNSVDLEPDENKKVNIVIPAAAVTSVNGDTGDVVLDADDVGALPVTKVTSGGVEMYRIDLGSGSNKQYVFITPSSDGAYIAVYPENGSYGITTYRSNGTIQKQVDSSTWVYARTPSSSGTLALLENLAPIYNSGKTYALGQLVTKDGALKKCTAEGTGSAAVFEEATVYDVLSTFYATAAQGSKADSAIQGIKVNDNPVTPGAGNVVNISVPTPPSPYTGTPKEASGSGDDGDEVAYAKGDHVHPAETSISDGNVYVRNEQVAKHSEIPTQASDVGALSTNGGDMSGTITWPSVTAVGDNYLIDAKRSDNTRMFAIRVAGDSIYLACRDKSIELPYKDGTIALLSDMKYDIANRSGNNIALLDRTVNTISASSMSGGTLNLSLPTKENDDTRSRDLYIAVTCGAQAPTLSITGGTLKDSTGANAVMDLTNSSTTVFHLTEIKNAENGQPAVFLVYGGKNGSGGSIDPSVVAGKADKVAGATEGNLAGLDSNGNLVDSLSKPSDFATSTQGAKADSAVQGVSLNGAPITLDGNKVANVKDIPMGALHNDVQAAISRSATSLLSASAVKPWDSTVDYYEGAVVSYNGKIFKCYGGEEEEEDVPAPVTGIPPEGDYWSIYYWYELTLVQVLSELIAPAFNDYPGYEFPYNAGDLCSYEAKVYECLKSYISGRSSSADSDSTDDIEYSDLTPDKDRVHWGERDVFDLLWKIRQDKQDKKIGTLFQVSVGSVYSGSGAYVRSDEGVYFNSSLLRLPTGAELRTIVITVRPNPSPAVGTFYMRILNATLDTILAQSNPVYISSRDVIWKYVFSFENSPLTIDSDTTYVIAFVTDPTSAPNTSAEFGYALDLGTDSNPDIGIRNIRTYHPSWRPIVSFGMFLTVDQLRQEMMTRSEQLIKLERALDRASLYTATQNAIDAVALTSTIDQNVIDAVEDANAKTALTAAKTAIDQTAAVCQNIKTALQAFYNALTSVRDAF